MKAQIDFPCGCCINETAVIAMCLKHDIQLRERRAEIQRAREEYQRQILDTVRTGIASAHNGRPEHE